MMELSPFSGFPRDTPQRCRSTPSLPSVALLFLFLISFSPNETSVEYADRREESEYGLTPFHCFCLAHVPVILRSLMSAAPRQKAIRDEPWR